jgi:hypothetical protein
MPDWGLVHGRLPTDAGGDIGGAVASMTESEVGVKSERASDDALG